MPGVKFGVETTSVRSWRLFVASAESEFRSSISRELSVRSEIGAGAMFGSQLQDLRSVVVSVVLKYFYLQLTDAGMCGSR